MLVENYNFEKAESLSDFWNERKIERSSNLVERQDELQ